MSVVTDMDSLEELLQSHVDGGGVIGAVASVSGPTGTEVVAVGHRDLAETVPMTRDTIFRVASVTKPMTAACVMTLVEEGRIALDDPVDRWVPELARAQVVRKPSSPVEDLVEPRRPATVEDLLTMRAGWGWASEFDLPAIAPLADRVERQGLPHDPRTPEEWVADLVEVPMLHQPGEAWLYNTCSDLQGVLVARVLDQPFADALHARVLSPLGMSETGFVVPSGQADRLADCTVAGDDGLVQFEEPDGSFLEPPGFAAGAGGLVSTLDDLHRFNAMLLGDGELDGVRVLRPETVAAMSTNHLTDAQRQANPVFLDGQGWGYGGGVDVERRDPWNVLGRYGWVGGTGTASYVVPGTGVSYVLLTQRMMQGPDDAVLLGEFCTYAARGHGAGDG